MWQLLNKLPKNMVQKGFWALPNNAPKSAVAARGQPCWNSQFSLPATSFVFVFSHLSLSFPRYYSTYVPFSPFQSSHFEWLKPVLVNFLVFLVCHQPPVSADGKRVTNSATCHVSSHPSCSSPFPPGEAFTHIQTIWAGYLQMNVWTIGYFISPWQQFNQYY